VRFGRGRRPDSAQSQEHEALAARLRQVCRNQIRELLESNSSGHRVDVDQPSDFGDQRCVELLELRLLTDALTASLELGQRNAEVCVARGSKIELLRSTLHRIATSESEEASAPIIRGFSSSKIRLSQSPPVQPTFEVCVRFDCCCELSHRVANVDSAAKSTKQPIELRNRQFDGSADSCDRQNRDRRVELLAVRRKIVWPLIRLLARTESVVKLLTTECVWNVSCCSELLRDDRVANAVARRPFALVWRHAPDWRRRQASKSASEKPVQKCC